MKQQRDQRHRDWRAQHGEASPRRIATSATPIVASSSTMKRDAMYRSYARPWVRVYRRVGHLRPETQDRPRPHRRHRDREHDREPAGDVESLAVAATLPTPANAAA
jgi:hypothetical protein